MANDVRKPVSRELQDLMFMFIYIYMDCRFRHSQDAW
jgi:hypothetical protein